MIRSAQNADAMKRVVISALVSVLLLACSRQEPKAPTHEDSVAAAMRLAAEWRARNAQPTSSDEELQTFLEGVMLCYEIEIKKGSSEEKARKVCAAATPTTPLRLPSRQNEAEDMEVAVEPLTPGFIPTRRDRLMYAGFVGAAPPTGWSPATGILIDRVPGVSGEAICDLEVVVNGRQVWFVNAAGNPQLIHVSKGLGMSDLGGTVTSVAPDGRRFYVMLSVLVDGHGHGRVIPVSVTKTRHSADIRCWQRTPTPVNPYGRIQTALIATLAGEARGVELRTGAGIRGQELGNEKFSGLLGGELRVPTSPLLGP